MENNKLFARIAPPDYIDMECYFDFAEESAQGCLTVIGNPHYCPDYKSNDWKYIEEVIDRVSYYLENLVPYESPSYEYPSFIKKLNETESDETFRRVYYLKHYDGSGEYIEEVYTAPKTDEKWRVIPNPKETVLESSPRFNLAKLISFC